MLALRGVCRRFGAVEVLKDVELEIHAGQVVALLGDNGAGKSTLVKVISGVAPADRGVIEWEGRSVHIRRPHDARDLGIATVHQDLALCGNLDVVGNLFLGREIRRFGFLDEMEMESRTMVLLKRLTKSIPDLRAPWSPCPAASGRRWPSHVRSSATPGSSSWTNRPRRWASSRRPRSWISSTRCVTAVWEYC